ncbi:MAG: trehalase family glycosidase [Bacteroidales bacterium]
MKTSLFFRLTQSLGIFTVGIGLISCKTGSPEIHYDRYNYSQIINISHTPSSEKHFTGCFSDQGAWIGFTLPERENWVNGFCGPFELEKRLWYSQALIQTGFVGEEMTNGAESFIPDSTNYFPGELYLSSQSPVGKIEQRLIFINQTNALLSAHPSSDLPIEFVVDSIANARIEIINNSIIEEFPDKVIAITFSPDSEIRRENGKILIQSPSGGNRNLVISHFNFPTGKNTEIGKANQILENATAYEKENKQRWDGYLKNTLRKEAVSTYDRVAVKAIVTLISNWRSTNKGLLHDGVVPSHAVGYFMGVWAWDAWKQAVAMASFAPDVAKKQIRAMFDYQLEDGMIIDCIYPDVKENNARNSKPPLAAWAVEEIYKTTGDTNFVREMFVPLVKYHRWWYAKRDHDGNGICEYGSTDGTLEAAAWESGMDNAIRFDEAQMVNNSMDAWSLDQESVDLNAFLAYEYAALSRMAQLIQVPFNEPDRTKLVADYFFDKKNGFFFDRKFDGKFISEEGSEAYIPLWTGIASKSHCDRMMPILTDTTKFSTYIPFPTVAADNPKFMPTGYWRGPIWLDQTYFAISGLRKYGYQNLADMYTRQVFERLDGLMTDGEIHENYGTHDGRRLKAPQFSWSAAHLLMLYREYGN